MEQIIAALLDQAPTVGVMFLMFWLIRQDVNKHLEYLESLIDRLIEGLTDGKPPE